VGFLKEKKDLKNWAFFAGILLFRKKTIKLIRFFFIFFIQITRVFSHFY